MPQPDPLRIIVILASTRQHRFGDTVARWFMRIVAQRPELDAELIDLRDWELPYYDRPSVAAASDYDETSTQWAQVVGPADGFVIITPEYNHGYPAVLKSALDAVYREWNRKPVSFVSYGGWSGGTRAMQQLRQVAVELQMTPVRSSVAFQFAPRLFDESGTPAPAEFFERAALALLDDLAWWARALKRARAETA